MILEAVATKLVVFDGGTVNLFEGTYFDFLERVGWQDEGGVQARNGKKKGSSHKAGNRKDVKKLRSSIVADKSKALGALKSRITSIETEITKLEQEVARDTQALLDASMKGEALAIKRLSQAVREAKERIEVLFSELEAVTQEHDAKASDFELKLSELAETS